jgi:arylsulfatase A-like enzyme
MAIVLVTADSVRADHCGWLSGEGEQSGPTAGPPITPTLTELADESVTYTSAIAPGPRTLSSVPVSHTGVPFACNNF